MYALDIEAANKKHQLLEHVLITNLEQQRELGCSMTNNHILYIDCPYHARKIYVLIKPYQHNTTQQQHHGNPSRLQTTSFGTLVQKNHAEASGATLRARHQRVTGRFDTKLKSMLPKPRTDT